MSSRREAAAPDAVDAWQAAGAKVETVGAAANGGGVDLDAVVLVLGQHGVLHTLVEGGGTLLGSVLAGGHAQRLVTYTAPLWLGTGGRSAFAASGPATLADASRYELVAVRAVGPDVRAEYEVHD